MSSFKTEEDVRTKSIYKFLNLRVDDENIYFEENITLRLGKKERKNVTLNGRADILVKNKKGENLLIWEIKKSTHKITKKDIEQGLSYARVVIGNLVPVTVLTNGIDTIVLNTITGEKIEKCTFNLIEELAANFISNEESERLMNNALEILIKSHPLELTEEFFNKQTFSATCNLIGHGKKYNSDIYIPIEDNISFIPNSDNNKLFLVSGKPQSGKTNYLVHNLKQLQQNGALCLFYSAFRVRDSLNKIIQRDVDEYFGSKVFEYKTILKNLSNRQSIYIFIDGLNEIEFFEREIIVNEFKSLVELGLNLVVSCSDMFLATISHDKNCNPSIFKDPHYKEYISKVTIDKNIPLKIDEIYSKYCQFFNVNLSANHVKSENIYLLRLAMEIYRDSKLPDEIDENQVVKTFLNEKCKNLDLKLKINSFELLKSLALKSIRTVEAVNEYDFFRQYSNNKIEKCPDDFISDGLLQLSDGFSPKIGFYYDAVRDFLLLSIYFKKQSFQYSILNINNAENKEIVNSVIHKHMVYEKIEYAELLSLSEDLFKDIVKVAAISFSRKKKLSGLEIEHFIENTKALYFNELYEEFATSFDTIVENNYKLYNYKKEIAQLLGCFIELNDHKFTNYSSELIWDFDCPIPNDSSDIYQYLAYLACASRHKEPLELLTFLNDIYIEASHIFDCDIKSNQSIMSIMADITDNAFNYVDVMCGGDSYLEILKEDYIYSETRREIDKLIQQLEYLCEAFEGSDFSDIYNVLLDELRRLV